MADFSAIVSTTASLLPPHCSPTNPFLAELSSYFYTCLPTPLALLSTTLGTLSIVSWLFAQLPQIYKNHQIQSTAGLSIFFLVEWCLGDATNLLGALFTNQAAWQVVVAGYYVFVDVCLVCQYFWYTHLKPAMDGRSLHSSNSSDGDGEDDVDSINGLSPINTQFRDEEWPSPMTENSKAKDSETSLPTTAPRFSDIAYEKAAPRVMSVRLSESSTSSWMPSPSPRTLFYISTSCALLSRANAVPTPTASLTTTAIHSLAAAESPLQIAGTILSWCSTILYLGSRLPQLYHNFSRKSTAGLSPLLFIAAFCGNFFYSSSLLTNPNAWHDFPAYGGHGWAGPQGSDRWKWVRAAAPFWLGAAGVLLMDGMMGVQFLLYGESDEEKVVRVRDSSGRTHWERVSGWMRGWVPSVRGKEKLVGLGESQRLIRESRELERSRYGSL